MWPIIDVSLFCSYDGDTDKDQKSQIRKTGKVGNSIHRLFHLFVWFFLKTKIILKLSVYVLI